ncbi:cation:proton antiporter [Pararhodonellum marinum]|uniref:cation:proton antiporter n=1 Tax=Pararhodonellum marinum TaxID=2755358 RepID=UPI00188EEA2B|nr:sodium:proton antiporter [Pararhodonellum marinum]
MDTYQAKAFLEEGNWDFFELDKYDVNLFYIGLIILIAGLLPRIIEKRLITAPIIYLLFGVAIFLIFPYLDNIPHLAEEPYWGKRLTEMGVIISLTGVGLKLNRPFDMETWRDSKRLLLVTMPLTMLACFAMGYWLMGLLPAAAVLLGAILAPTDPVLASDVQTTPPDQEDYSKVKLALTTEAGLNDGLAFPFTNMAIAIAIVGISPTDWFTSWFVMDFLYKIIGGTVIGIMTGWLLAKLLFSIPQAKSRLPSITTGIIALSLTLIPYAIAEMLSTYGFITVFVAACVFRNVESKHEYLETLHDFSEELERILIAVLFVLLGCYLVMDFPADFELSMVPIALLTIFVIRPLAGMVSFWKSPLLLREKWVISFFGIRGIGSLYYLLYAFEKADFPQKKLLLAFTVTVIVLSIFIHGLTAQKAVSWATND